MRNDPTIGGATAADRVVVIGAGPAGLTAAYELGRRGKCATVLEASDVVGGISQTAVRNGWRFDIGGHRFFTKVPRVEDFWHEILSADEFLRRPRMSRILYAGRFYDYPLRAMNALTNLGVVEAVRCVLSYGLARIRPPKDQSHFEGWVSSRFGARLYSIFFKTYTEKVWGVPANTIQADWAAQRIRNLSLGKAVRNSLRRTKGQTAITSLIDEFQYPRLGPGMMWEQCCNQVVAQGSTVHMESAVARILRDEHGATAVVTNNPNHGEQVHAATAVISSMPIGDMVRAMDPPPPCDVLAAADSLSHRDFITVALVVPGEAAFPDNWIYVHDPNVALGRIQNFASWSPFMVKEGMTCLGLEYFVNEGDELWCATDAELIALGERELSTLGLVPAGRVVEGHVVRMPKAYPMYDTMYRQHVDTIRAWLEAHVPNVFPVGRNGMHRYNNSDHSMYTAMLTVDNMFGATHDVWSVNVEDDYHEEGHVLQGGRDTQVSVAVTGAAVPMPTRNETFGADSPAATSAGRR